MGNHGGDVPRIYVACLASYNNGTLHGAWIDCDQDADDIREEIADMLRKSTFPNVMVPCPDCPGMPEGVADDGSIAVCDTCHGRSEVPSAEEWAIHDYEGFGPRRLHESESIDDVAALADGIIQHGPAFAAWADYLGEIPTEDDFTESYMGQHGSAADYVAEFCADCFESPPEWCANYINYEAMARDWSINGDITEFPVPDDPFHVYIFRRV